SMLRFTYRPRALRLPTTGRNRIRRIRHSRTWTKRASTAGDPSRHVGPGFERTRRRGGARPPGPLRDPGLVLPRPPGEPGSDRHLEEPARHARPALLFYSAA